MSNLPEGEPRESMDFDVVIVGAGPAGLSAAIRLKQLNKDLSVVVVEKGAEVGAHILSGAVVDPVGIDKLLPDWQRDPRHPFKTRVTRDEFLWLGKTSSFRLPNFLMPPLMNNHGNYIISLGNMCRWLAQKAENMGVEIYPGFAATEILFNADGAVTGIATGDMGVEKNGQPGPEYARGMELLGKYTLFGEGARGSLSKQLIAKFKLDYKSEPAKFGLGIKELWQVAPENHQPGLVRHAFGWPLKNDTGGGAFLYHLEGNRVAVGHVIHLDYKNPYLSPFETFQQFKTPPAIKDTFKDAKRISFGARVISEGGWQSVPKLSFPGGALIGCSAGFVNLPRIKGTHNAMLSGMLGAEKISRAIAQGRANDEPRAIEESWRAGAIGADLKKVRNVKPLWSRFGTLFGVGLGGIDMWMNSLFGLSLFGTLGHKKTDAASLQSASKSSRITYPKPDSVLTFDRLSSVFLSNTNHEENQPVHLQLGDKALQKNSELALFDGPSVRYCPANVYEWSEIEGEETFVINAQNCLHCKTCDIKDPNQNITWTPPQGGEGPLYQDM